MRSWKRMTRLAREAPTSSVSRVQPPAAGTRPSAVSGSQKRALGPTSRTSHARAHSKPPATAAPSTTAIETKGALAMSSKTRCDCMCSASAARGLVTRSRSAPAQKKRGSDERKTAARQRCSMRAGTSRSRQLSISELYAFACDARVIVTMATPPTRLTSREGIESASASSREGASPTLVTRGAGDGGEEPSATRRPPGDVPNPPSPKEPPRPHDGPTVAEGACVMLSPAPPLCCCCRC